MAGHDRRLITRKGKFRFFLWNSAALDLIILGVGMINPWPIPMPHAHEPDPASPPPRKPACPACGKDMRLVAAKPTHYINLDDCTYRCECGEEAQYLLMRPD